jgi:hypothetical protein
MHYLVAVSIHGERCACGVTAPRLVEHLADVELAHFGIERVAA